MALSVTTARRSKLIMKSGFKGYDVCLNPYVGCHFGCTYCYVRFFVKDKDHDWGDFLRVRRHIADKLPRELPNHNGERLVIGTMTDPYQPNERKHRVTREALQHIIEHGNLNKVGIFTRSPIILEDIDLIRQLPRARVHYTITPYPRDIITKLEPIPVLTERRFKTVEKLKEAGIRVHVNVAPTLPVWSEQYTEQFAKRLAKIGVEEFFVDPMQPYRESFQAVFGAVQDEKDWPEVQRIISDKDEYLLWKQQQRLEWEKVWAKHGNKNTLAIWSDHESKTWIDMATGDDLDPDRYGDDLD